MGKSIYMDYAATTYTKPEVLEEMLPYFTNYFGNPSSIYSVSDKTKRAINISREKIAKAVSKVNELEELERSVHLRISEAKTELSSTEKKLASVKNELSKVLEKISGNV